ncbi:MAG: right-handed parallel beta-helix repeat-containing protein, partial [Thermoplasmata archaeon]|nr:right-handed parallel beta-helix repeat-containing protein [Thermoplasmata archaeon]
MKKAGTLATVLVFIGMSFTAFSILPATVAATTLYVGGGGPGNYTTIQSAIDATVPGNTIFVYNGTYNENLLADKTLSLIGESRDSTWINGGGFGDTIYVTADWVNLTGFFVWNGGLNGWDAGIELDQVQNCYIADNNFIVNDFDGIFLRSSSNNTIANNTVAFNPDIGIYLLSSHNNTIIGNNVSSNGFNIALDSSHGNIIANNNASDSDTGIGLFYSDHNIVTGNNASNNSNRGIYLEYSDNNRVEDNTASNNGNEGIHIRLCLDNKVAENNVSHNEAGIYLWHADRNSIVDNTASHNVYGVFADRSMYDTFTGNVMVENGFYLNGNMRFWNTHTIDASNTVNGKPVRYWKNVTGGTVPSDAGQVILANCTGVTVEDQNISEATVGIAIGHSSGNTISHNALSSNSISGIMLDSSEHISVSQNTAYGNTYGISIFGRGRNNITGNTVSLNWRGIFIRGSNENIADNNTVSENGGGFDLLCSDGNVLSNNSIRFNSEHGASVVASNGNRVLRNLIFSNGLGVSVRFSTGNTV